MGTIGSKHNARSLTKPSGPETPPSQLQIAAAAPIGRAMGLHLHIGAHKTATTHLQATLIRGRAALAKAGVQVERPDDIRALIGAGARAAALAGPLPSLRRAGAAGRLARLDAGAARLVISDENSLGLCAEIFEQHLIYPTARRRLTIWRRLAARRETVVYLGVRSYDAFLSGAFVQSIRKTARPLPHPDALAALRLLPRRWPDIVADIRYALPGARIKAWAFEAYPQLSSRLTQELTGQILPAINRRPMATPSQEAVRLFLKNPAGARTPLHHLAADHPITGDNPKFSLWSDDDSAAMAENYASDLATLRADLGEDFLTP